MRDIFGIAAAIVIALLSQIVEPWSTTWWAGMILSGAIATFAAGHIFIQAATNLRETRAIVNAWGPWLLIIGGPFMGIVWLYLSPHITFSQAWMQEQSRNDHRETYRTPANASRIVVSKYILSPIAPSDPTSALGWQIYMVNRGVGPGYTPQLTFLSRLSDNVLSDVEIDNA